MTTVDWTPLVDFWGGWSTENKWAVYLALDMVYLMAAGTKTPQEIINMVSGGQEHLKIKDDPFPNSPANIDRDKDTGTWMILIPGANGSQNLLSPEGIYSILHEMGHLTDVWLTTELQGQWPGWDHSFSRTDWPTLVDGWGWGGAFWKPTWKWQCNYDDGSQKQNCKGGQAPTDRDTRTHWNVGEDFAGSFASVIMHQFDADPLYPSSINGNPLEKIVCCDSRAMPVDKYRQDVIITVLRDHTAFRPPIKRITGRDSVGKWR
jgi:hypothetical protein